MLEKVIENWLDKAGEKTFQSSFCAMLMSEGHTIIHLTRHCAMELGKDILTIDSSGNPCAFQLKGNPGSRLSLDQWRKEVSSQVLDLVTGKIVHPSISSLGKQHRSYLVTNGDLEEEVSRAIDDMNRSWSDQGLPYKLEVIVRGQMLDMAKRLGSNLWPSELYDTKLLLEFYLADGKEPLQRDKLIELIEKMLLQDDSKKPRSKEGWKRHYASAVLLVNIATKTYKDQKNYLAEIESWTILCSMIMSSAERFSLKEKNFRDEYLLAMESCEKAVVSLLEEAFSSSDLIEGEPITDVPYSIYKVRLTWLVSLACYYFLYRRINNVPSDEFDKKLMDFRDEHISDLIILGESSFSQWLIIFWSSVVCQSAKMPADGLIRDLLEMISVANQPTSNEPLPSPYYLIEQLLPYYTGIADKPLNDSFKGSSYYLELFVNLNVRNKNKDALIKLWPLITRIAYRSFLPDENLDFYKFKIDKGVNLEKQPLHTKQWDELLKESDESEGRDIPVYLKKRPEFYLLMTMFMPFRVTSSSGRWLDKQISLLKKV